MAHFAPWGDPDYFEPGRGHRSPGPPPPYTPCPPCPPCPPCRPCGPCSGGGRPSIFRMQQEVSEENEDLYMTDEPEKEWMEQDWQYMKSMYPAEVRRYQRYVEDAGDRLEYENSMMFDEYPDKEALTKQVNDIKQSMDQDMAEGDMPADEMYIWLMLLPEMNHRRWRYAKRRRRFY